MKVTVPHLQTPDPRLPRRSRGLVPLLQGWMGREPFALWRYEGTAPHSAVPPPPAEVAARVAGLAATPFSLGRWRQEARVVAASLGNVLAAQVAAVMVHPPPIPDGERAWNWLRACQMAAALVLAEREEGRELLRAIVLGPEDWSAGCAALALAEAVAERSAEAARMLQDVLVRLEAPPSHGDWGLEYPLLLAALRVCPPGATRLGLESRRQRYELQALLGG